MPRKKQNPIETAKVEETLPKPTNFTPTVIEKTTVSKAKEWSKNYFSQHLQATVIVLLAIVSIGGIGFGIFTHNQLRTEKNKTSDLAQKLSEAQKTSLSSNQNESQSLLATVGKLMILPEGENPTIATVSDLSKLQNQPFFKNAEVGDKVLIYNQSKKAILFRPSTSKIIEYAPLQTEDTSKEGNVAGTATQKPKPSPIK